VREVDVQVLHGAGGRVFKAAAEVLGLELANVEGEGEPLEAAPPAPLQGFEERIGGVVGAEMEVEGGGRRPAARPERAPPGGERARADGGFEREQAEDVQPQRLR
jgi:hypothetical protein